MAEDEFAQFGGYEITAAPAPAPVDEFAQFGGRATPADDDTNDWRAFASLARRLFMPGAAPSEGELRGASAALKRQPLGEDATIEEKFSSGATRVGLPIGGAALAASMATAALPAAAPLAARVGQTAIMAGLEGAGAATGDAASMGISKALGGNAPETAKDAAIASGKTGLETALAALGMSGIIGAVKVAAPHILQSMKVVPAESMARQIEKNGAPLKGGKLTLQGAELKGAHALRRVQLAAQKERAAVGQEVDAALEAFESQVKGQPVVNVRNAADSVDAVLNDAGLADELTKLLGGGNEAIEEAVKASDAEVSLIRNIVNAIKRKPNMTPKEAVNLRRAIDNLTAFRKGGAPQVSSAIGQRAAHALGASLREGIEEAAKANGAQRLLSANSKASAFYKQYENVGEIISTRSTSVLALRNRLRTIAGLYNQGGVPKAVVMRLGKILKRASGDVENLIDMATAREFLKGVAETPSGISMSHLRGMIAALGTARLLPAGKQAAALARLLPRIGAGAASKANQRAEKPSRPE